MAISWGGGGGGGVGSVWEEVELFGGEASPAPPSLHETLAAIKHQEFMHNWLFATL